MNYTANGSYYVVSSGQQMKLPNYVKERGRNDCYLKLVPIPAVSTILYGVWSPDSI